MRRAEWQNLNGEWTYAVTHRYGNRPASFAGRIIVPFPIESQLSKAGIWVSPDQRLWYRRTFVAPTLAAGHRLLLHFGAVDWEAVVSVNGRQVGEHRGGFDPFVLDITDALRRDSAEQELVVAVRDPTDGGDQPRGKQVLRPRSIYYTAVTGIWQTVWLEPVPAAHITALRIDPDLDAGTVLVMVSAAGDGRRVTVTALDGEREVARQSGEIGAPLTLSLTNPRKWSPVDPFLYRLRVRLDPGDEVESYVGMRSIAVRRDASGVRRLFLNGEALFQFGLLDQGWWPDGLYTAPTDEALASDIQKTKELGFNVIRKHVKVEPSRWYYHCDRVGMIVWQDMPSAEDMSPDGEPNFARELAAVVDALRNHPSIVMWVPFNEDWGQHSTAQHVSWLKSYDPTRLVNNASGWTDMKVGDVVDLHAYPGPATPPIEEVRAAVLGEFGGLGLPLDGHTWLDRGNWGYRSFKTLEELNAAYLKLLEQLRMHVGDGLSSAIYTQTTDVEIEVNGVMTYDRAVVKLSAEAIAANKRLYEPPPVVRHVMSASDRSPQPWRYTTTQPAATWFEPGFNDAGWASGSAGFGAPATRHARVGTPWQTSDIWIRRSFDLPAETLSNPHLRVFHDDDTQVYVNGQLVAELTGANSGFAFVPLGAPARSALRPGSNTIAVHTHQTRGGQFIDVGLVDVVDK
jgi:Glycosyl hydrolase 2 galactose-binding domain-like/Glycosyl hydrolases family 2/Glycosyl hydrolases family 2, TIM barrel domain